jgi:glycosyltransferase involved in cell wall biosynthesis
MLKKKVLIICSYFPPTLNGGSKRPYLFAKELESKYDVTILTIEKNTKLENNLFRVEYFKFWKENLWLTFEKIFFEFFFKFGFVSATDFYLQRQAKNKKLGSFDIIIGTYPEISNLLIARSFKRKNPDSKLIIDFRDGLLQESLRSWNFLQKKSLLKFEREICNYSDHVITVGENITEYFKTYTSNISTIFNSHELNSQSSNIIKKKHTNLIKFIHFGSLGASKDRNLLYFFEALKLLKLQNDFNFIIDFIGNISSNEKKLFELFELNDVVNFKKPISREQRESTFSNYDFALLIGVEGQKTYISSKVFDYIEYKLPILAICKGNEVEEIISSNKFGITCDFDANSILNAFKYSKLNKEIYYLNYNDQYSSKFQMNKLSLLCLDI